MEVSGELHAPAALPPGETAPGTHWIGSWVSPRDVLDAVVNRKMPSSRRESNPRTPIVQPEAQRYTDWAITVLNRTFWPCKLISATYFNLNFYSYLNITGIWSREIGPSTQRIGGWMGPRAGLDAVVKKKIPSPCQDSNSPSSSP
jgi:hypothetical protein